MPRTSASTERILSLVSSNGRSTTALACAGLVQTASSMLDADVFVLHLLGQILGGEHDLVHTLGDVYLSGLGAGAADARHLAQLAVQGRGQGADIVSGPFQQAGNKTLLLTHQGAKQMVHIHLLVPEANGHGLGFGHGFL